MTQTSMMYPLRLSRSTARAAYQRLSFRPMATPSGQDPPNRRGKQNGSNTFLYVVLGATAAGSAYYYLMQDKEISGEIKAKAKADKEHLKSRARDAIDNAKERSAETEKRAKEDYQQLMDKLAGLKSTAEKDLRDVEVRGKSIGEDLESKYESAKGSARAGLNRVRDSTENIHRETRSSAERGAHVVRDAATEVKQGWFSWLGWGRSKVDEHKQRVASEADESQRESGKR